MIFRKTAHPKAGEAQGWEEASVNDTLNIFDNTEQRTPTVVIENHMQDGRFGIREDNVFGTMQTNGGGEITSLW